ncbi:aldo/keto reductase [Methanosarcina sp. WWM596]|uniref:aldo/keto reductase n=1 Tax=Methanosarcina sp. WWM596 TaxID=1434103 RepID=UPI000615ECA5|nr:aldo/keto reductase [Methanosarcina sp. WWM596]AKB18835.1 Oxidoreductase [Methanosarcina sp. WWM596]
MISRLTLGTAQLGLDYGINNLVGKPKKREALKILEYAYLNNINSFDTASAYGDSESIVGNFLKTKHSKCYITSKLESLSKNNVSKKDIERIIYESIEKSAYNLDIECIDNYLIHDFQDIFFYDELLPSLKKAKRDGLIDNLGVSIYTPNEAEKVMQMNAFDTIQIPLNIFDQRFLSNSLLKRLKEKNFIIFSRSVFLQGLFFKDRRNLPTNLTHAKNYLIKLDQLAEEKKVTISKLALDFVKSIEEIDSIVIGVDSLQQLNQNIKDFESNDTPGIDMSAFANINENVIDPRKW